MADSSEKEVIRITWDEWLASRATKRAALAAKGLSAPSCRTRLRALQPVARRRRSLERSWRQPEIVAPLRRGILGFAVGGEIC